MADLNLTASSQDDRTSSAIQAALEALKPLRDLSLNFDIDISAWQVQEETLSKRRLDHA